MKCKIVIEKVEMLLDVEIKCYLYYYVFDFYWNEIWTQFIYLLSKDLFIKSLSFLAIKSVFSSLLTNRQPNPFI